ncbi:rho guanine nucleotide exchange factor 15 [Huso huso]|uniref:Rho guanine nucleotide exchange factor 15 n=1 Tax=Huso huso TaxID=61971 RepID=A0ABR0Z0M8_HUSHU
MSVAESMPLPRPRPRERRSRPPVKPKPAIPCKPSLSGSPENGLREPALPLLPNETRRPLAVSRSGAERAEERESAGKVQRILNHFRQQEKENVVKDAGKCPPPVSAKPPKPLRGGCAPPSEPPAPQPALEKPPLPPKEKRKEQGEHEAGRGGDKPDQDGKEAESQLQSNGSSMEAGSSLPPPGGCRRDCSCLCHQKRAGMILVWVPAGESQIEEEERDTDSFSEEETQMVQDSPAGGQSGSNSQSSQGIPESSVMYSEMTFEAPSLDREKTETPDSPAEEDPVYESTIETCRPEVAKETSARVPKPPRKFKQPPQASSSTEREVEEEEEEPPPALPPRLPRKPPRPASVPHGGQGAVLQAESRHSLNLTPGSPAVVRRSCSPCPEEGVPSSLSRDPSKDEGDEIGSDWDELDDIKDISEPILTRRVSIDWEAKLQDEPLYQTYRETVISKEIKRQSVSRNLSKTSWDYSSEPSSQGPPRGQVRTGPPQSSLWQELQSVRESGVLAELTLAECKFQESMFEVLTSEASYLRSLNVLTDHFLDSRELSDTIIIRERKILFSNITRVKEVSERFLKDLEERVEESLVISDICDIIHYHAQHHFPVYIDYVRNQIYQEKTYSALMERNVQFASVITRLQESPQCQRLPFMSFLLLPFQRITRIRMLVENILKRTEEGTSEEQNASRALVSVSKIIAECNSEVGKMKQVEELIHIAKSVEFDKLKALPLISQTRYLEKRGELLEAVRGGTLFSSRPRFSPVYLFLFNDLLLITNKKSGDRYVVVDHAHRSLVQVQSNKETSLGPGLDHCFYLTILENHQGKMMERLLKAPNQSDMHRWMAAFPNPGDPEKSNDETIYEDWDCPQVQCIEAYSAQQADELSLERTDIVNVLRKTTEGWCEGIRLADGQKGWFPGSIVQEITNEHVRRRNLRERYRVIQAAEQMTKSRTIS